MIALAAGGTGGHLFPAEALAAELKRRSRSVLLVTDARGARYADSFPADDRFEISAASPSIGGPVAKAIAAASLAGGLLTSLKELKRRHVAAAVGFGGYPSLPAMKAAALLRIPYGVHEQNGVLGRTNRMLASGAAFVAHAFPILDKAPAGAHKVEVGNPLREAVVGLANSGYRAPGASDPIRLLIFGGSQGASIFSAVPPAIAGLPEALRQRIKATQQAREEDIAKISAAYASAGIEAEVAPFFKDLPARIAASHLVIARAGASTVSEIATIGRPSILVPLAIAMDDHQTGNARVLSEANAAIILPEKAFTEESLRASLAPLLAEPRSLAEMAAQARGRVKAGAAKALADLVESVAVNAKKAA